ncbi:oxidative damage protection protein [uncultured Oceanicoccus sp.]|uniref:oxidative damage protection protein n=1 Tax=uncultured Oceanicoccus sp. TaxID=1706381 RepID=UPI0030D6E7A1
MSRTVFCKKYQQQLEGLDTPPYPGAKGQEIFATISKKAWQEWLAHQTMLINERQLNMIDAKDRQFLQLQMDKFMAGEDYAKADGYVPEQDK